MYRNVVSQNVWQFVWRGAQARVASAVARHVGGLAGEFVDASMGERVDVRLCSQERSRPLDFSTASCHPRSSYRGLGTGRSAYKPP